MADIINPVLFNDLAACDPADILARTGCAYDEASGCYTVRIWDDTYDIIPSRQQIILRSGGRTSDGIPGDDYTGLFALHYLMKASRDPLSNDWVSEKDIPGGAAFFRGPHTLPTGMITRAFDNDTTGFERQCRGLGGVPLAMADAAFYFEITPKIRVAALYWLGDEDFGCEAKLLFDRSVGSHLPLDIVYALAVAVCRILGRRP